MNQNKFLKIFSIIAFAAFLFISCWATVESLKLLQPSLPILGFWVVTVGFYVLAAIGSKLIVDSFNQRIRVENRGWRLIGGSIMLGFFWILFFLPTNTHTAFYKTAIKDVLVRDLTDTKTRLQNLENEGDAKKIIDQEKANFKNIISIKFEKFAREINNPGDPGWADKAERALLELEAAFGNNVTIQRLKLRCNSHPCRKELVNAMREQKDTLVASTIKSVYDQRIANINQSLIKSEIKNLISEIQAVQNIMQAMPNHNDEPTEKTSIVLSQAYKIIDNYSDVLIDAFDKSHPDKIRLAKEDKRSFSGVSKTEKMRSVFEVWKDFLAGKYQGRGFISWIIIAALVDIAGFIFFDIAFKKEEY